MNEMLMQPDKLSDLLGRPELVIVDCRFDLLKPAAGRLAWEAGHIPGAYYADLDRDLAGPRTSQSGRHPLPDPEAFANLLGSWGVTPASLVVAYDASGGAIAARLWWLLRWVGHERVALLDGGYQDWQAAKLPDARTHPHLHAGRYPVKPGSMPVLSTDQVQEGLRSGTLLLVDARDAQRFSGAAEPIDFRAGHIPGAINRPFQTNLDALGHFRAPSDLEDSFSLLPLNADQHLACMCGSGVTACHNLFALELAGVAPGALERPSLYAGSWSEWIQSPDRPIAASESSESSTRKSFSQSGLAPDKAV
jgi:thiosulfate/3-mercaptopyruvate sulfurtransferase